MSATAALSTRTCPAWCSSEADGIIGIHMGEVHSVGDLVLSLAQAPGEAAPTIGLNDDMDQEVTLTLDEAEQLGTILLQLARSGRKTACRAA